MLANAIANQAVHEHYGGVVPELASRAHAQNIVPTLESALQTAGIEVNELDAVAYTRGPGLMGSLHVGTAFAKSWAWAHGLHGRMGPRVHGPMGLIWPYVTRHGSSSR